MPRDDASRRPEPIDVPPHNVLRGDEALFRDDDSALGSDDSARGGDDFAQGADEPGFSNDERLEQLRRLATLMDSLFVIPGLNLRIGLDALLGLVPGLGDTVTALVTLYTLKAGVDAGVPHVTLARMTANILIDLLLGAVPLVGDLFDMALKANLRNVALLERHLATSPAESHRARRSDWLFIGAALLLVVAAIVGLAMIGVWIVGGVVALFRSK